MLLHTVSQLGGVVRTPKLHESGFSRHRVERAVDTRQLVRVRKGWVALPGADPQLVFAAEHGLTISCVTQAKRLGLWVREHRHGHFAVSRHGAERRPKGSRLHYNRPIVVREPFTLADEIENVLHLVAQCLPFDDAVAVWDSALNRGLVNYLALQNLPLRGPAKLVLRSASPFADSGLETYVRRRLRWLRVKIQAQAWVYGHRVDFLLGDRLILQIDGGHHVGAQRVSDIEHDAEIRLQGYTVIRVSYEQVMHRWPDVQGMVMRAIAQGLHMA